ncbi:MAG: radical SAM protein [Polyangiaceae bacterium]
MHRSLPIYSTPRVAHARAVASVPTPEWSGPKTVRISLTDRCDLACVYCRPDRNDGYLAQEERLDVEGWRVMLQALVDAGVRRIRLTGGEPLLHPHVVEITRLAASLPITDLALTTNATQLSKLAVPLRDAGLHRVTVSLDTLDPRKFDAITRGGSLLRFSQA